jgi:hypothetical protein
VSPITPCVDSILHPLPPPLILAAGISSRYAGTKWDDPVGPNGESIMEYSIFDARRAGFAGCGKTPIKGGFVTRARL